MVLIVITHADLHHVERLVQLFSHGYIHQPPDHAESITLSAVMLASSEVRVLDGSILVPSYSSFTHSSQDRFRSCVSQIQSGALPLSYLTICRLSDCQGFPTKDLLWDAILMGSVVGTLHSQDRIHPAVSSLIGKQLVNHRRHILLILCDTHHRFLHLLWTVALLDPHKDLAEDSLRLTGHQVLPHAVKVRNV